MNTQQPGTFGPAPAYLRWNADGVSPTRAANRLLNDPRLQKPTLVHTSVTVRLVLRSSLEPARSGVRRRTVPE